jgi:hypothetical protein
MEMSQCLQSSKFVGAVLALLTLLLGARALPAKDGRDFAGTYQIKAAVHQGQNVQVTLAFNITNYSGADVAGGTVTLVNPFQAGSPAPGAPAIVGPAAAGLAATTYGSFTSAAISNRRSIQEQSTYTVPLAEYQSWLTGHTPTLVYDRKDAAGHTIRRRVELVRIP